MSERDSQQTPPPGSTPPRRSALTRNPLLIIAIVLAVVIFGSLVLGELTGVEIEYSVFYRYLDRMPQVESGLVDPNRDGNILEVTIGPREIIGRLRPAPEDEATYAKSLQDGILRFRTQKPEADANLVEKLVESLHAKGVQTRFKHATQWAMVVLWIVPVLLIMLMFGMMFRSSRMTGENVLSFGRSRAKIVGEDKTGVNFGDVAGADEAKEELSEIVEFLKDPDRFTVLGGKIPKGVLLVGAPGCGKTLLARAVAGEAGVPFFSISGSDFVEMFVGVGAARVRDLFNTAKQKAPCIIFVDEIDAVGRHRGTGLGGGHDEREQTLNQLLVEMDGFDGRKGVIVIAATNRPDILDPALLRPGRFDRNVALDPPDFRGREAVLRIHSRGKPLAPTVDIGEVAKRTPGFSGADLANVMNEAALLAARRDRTDISMAEILEAIERVIAGPERRSRVIGPREKRIIAYHELGHALVARFSDGTSRVRKITIIPRGRGALGYTMTLPDEDRNIQTKSELLTQMRVALGGRSAEEVVFDHKSSGASDDLQRVTSIARAIVCRLGMSETLGPVTYDREPRSPFVGRGSEAADVVSERTAAEIDREVRALVHACHTEALEIIRKNRGLLDSLAQQLLEKETLEGDEFEALVQKYAEEPPPPLSEPVMSAPAVAQPKQPV